MTEQGECCGWASWGALAGMGDGSVRVDTGEEQDKGACSAQVEAGSGEVPTKNEWTSGTTQERHSGRRARAELALSRWKLAERNKRG
jgi:hypothetical protein